MKKVFLTGEWNNLVMANYPVDPAILKKYTPFHTELDSFEGDCYVSLVGFMFNNVKIRGIAVPFHVNFPEVNLRFYVRYKVGNEWQRGVVFIREIVPRPAIAFVANTFYKERYVAVPMRSSKKAEGDTLSVAYEWKWKGAWNSIRADARPTPEAIRNNSAEEFITEHYWGYSAVGETITNEYGVEHPKWGLYPLIRYEVTCDFGALYGNEFAGLSQQTLASVFHAVGSSVLIRMKSVLTV